MSSTKHAFLGSCHIYAGAHYGPGADVEVPEGMIIHDGHVLGENQELAPEVDTPDPVIPGGSVDQDPSLDPDVTPLPEDFPGREELVAAGVTSIEAALERTDTLVDIDGIGPATAKAITESLEAHFGGNAE